MPLSTRVANTHDLINDFERFVQFKFLAQRWQQEGFDPIGAQKPFCLFNLQRQCTPWNHHCHPSNTCICAQRVLCDFSMGPLTRMAWKLTAWKYFFSFIKSIHAIIGWLRDFEFYFYFHFIFVFFFLPSVRNALENGGGNLLRKQ